MGNILLVDDDLLVLDVTGAMLERLKHRVWKVGNATDALAIIRSGRQSFDLAIVDLVLKGCSGIDLVRDIRVLQPSLPMIVISGYLGPQSSAATAMLVSLGVTEVLAKPATLEDLDAAIKVALEE